MTSHPRKIDSTVTAIRTVDLMIYISWQAGSFKNIDSKLHAQYPVRRSTRFRLAATVYSHIHKLHSTSGSHLPCADCGPTMPQWRGIHSVWTLGFFSTCSKRRRIFLAIKIQ